MTDRELQYLRHKFAIIPVSESDGPPLVNGYDKEQPPSTPTLTKQRQPGNNEDPTHQADRVRPRAMLQVSKAWREVIFGIQDEDDQLTQSIELQPRRKDALQDFFLELEHRGLVTQGLACCMIRQEEEYFVLLKGGNTAGQLEAIAVDWDRIFRRNKRIVRLDLSLVPTDSHHWRHRIGVALLQCA